MKKIITIMLCISIFAMIADAKTLYVDAIAGSDTYNATTHPGTSWATAFQSIAFAQSHGLSNGDNIWIAGGSTYSIPSAASNATAQVSALNQYSVNWYGGFKGDETSLSQRPLADNDGNGIVEPWEFQYPTVLSFILNQDVSAFNGGNGDFNGFTMSATSTLTSKFNFLYTIGFGTKFTNNIVKNNTLTLAMTSSASDTFWPFFRMLGTLNNCLFENNIITVNASVNGYCFPFVWVANSTTATVGTKLSNTIIRNNKVTVDFSMAPSGTANTGTRGLILSITPALNPTSATNNTGGLPTVISNCVIHNNEMLYIPGSAAATMSNGATVQISSSQKYSSVSQPSTDSLINCTIVNNKGTKIRNSGLHIMSDAYSYDYVYNNVFYNNQNSSDGTTYLVSNMVGTISNNIGLISNNFTNGGAISNTANQIVNQDNTLDAVTNKPNFKTPTTTIGNTTDNSSEASYWSITSGSYLIAKGAAVVGESVDKDGNLFAATRAVGAYEYVSKIPLTISWTQNLSGLKATDSPVALTATTDGGVNGATITYSSGDPTIVSISGSTLTILKVGTTTVTANQASLNGNYSAATPVVQNVTVTDMGTGIDAAKENSDKIFIVNKNSIISKVQGSIQVISLSGQVVKNITVTSGQIITMPTGTYIIRVTTEKGVFVNKIII